MIQKPDCFAVSGAPGAGKTTLLMKLATLRYAVVPESARAVIRENHGRPEPRRFCELMLARDIAAFHAAHGLTLFDRCLVDAWGTSRAYGIDFPEGEAAVRELRLNDRAFIAPPWREIYCTDTERKETWVEAIASYERVAKAYEDAGYTLVELPRLPVDDRAAFVIEQVKAR